jgi:hypothetical protein
MLPDDRYRTQFELTTASLLAWSGFIRDVAAVSVDDAQAYWSMAAMPKASTACPVVLVLGRSTQTFSVTLGAETYEDLPVDDFDLFLPLLETVAAGDVVERTFTGAATARPVAIEMRVGNAGHPLFARTRRLATTDGAVLYTDRHFLPYRRDRAR